MLTSQRRAQCGGGGGDGGDAAAAFEAADLAAGIVCGEEKLKSCVWFASHSKTRAWTVF